MLAPMLDGQIALDSIRPLSRAEYDRMVELGMFANEHIELLHGVLVKMSPIGWLHHEVVTWLAAKMIRLVDETYSVSCQGPIAASDWSEPEPDLAVSVVDRSRRDHPKDLLLVVEVAESSLRHDRTTKLALYAESKIPEYWIVNLNNATVEVYTQPTGSAYAKLQTLRDGDMLRPLELPMVAIPISDMPR
jgi:Uma2 family endonuclease